MGDLESASVGRRRRLVIAAITDCDPHGIDIALTYERGSRSLRHEPNARVSNLEWLGLELTGIAPTTPCEQTPPSMREAEQQTFDRALMPLSLLDDKKARVMLAKLVKWYKETDPESSTGRNLLRMRCVAHG